MWSLGDNLYKRNCQTCSCTSRSHMLGKQIHRGSRFLRTQPCRYNLTLQCCPLEPSSAGNTRCKALSQKCPCTCPQHIWSTRSRLDLNGRACTRTTIGLQSRKLLIPRGTLCRTVHFGNFHLCTVRRDTAHIPGEQDRDQTFCMPQYDTSVRLGYVARAHHTSPYHHPAPQQCLINLDHPDCPISSLSPA